MSKPSAAIATPHPTCASSDRAQGGRALDAPARLGCVSFLNARPLIEDIDADDLGPGASLRVAYDVPSRLLGDLESGAVDMALCPVIDYQRSAVPLVAVPAGGIGCDGPTLTVRLYSRQPLERIEVVHADTDSHTSVCLLRVLLDRLYGCRPRIVDFDPRSTPPRDDVDAMLLIGDKVVTSAPPDARFPWQLDLGEAWGKLTGLPFVFALWMARAETFQTDSGARRLTALAGRLKRVREHNAGRIDAIVARRATAAGWPDDLARDYLGHMLRYEIGPRQLKAIEQFFVMAYDLHVIQTLRPLCLAGIEPAPAA